MKTLLEVCKGVYEIRRKEWARNYDFTDYQILELYGGTIEAAAKVMGYKFAPMTVKPSAPPPVEPAQLEPEETQQGDNLEDLW